MGAPLWLSGCVVLCLIKENPWKEKEGTNYLKLILSEISHLR